ncbi:agamous-like MADS-box protein AGL80 [Ipomoea triloba]|uniref:agamous-like MADS-box protein AGL80 n=1 Tax=Ipomoea triloba TaxID=35885 RepID=UPI00125DA5DA|nr:agamous-like MADS-box protein AGL80 [Ipomoea triloba]
MTRRRLRLAYIVNESKRKTSYRKRKNGMLKKLNELTILCGVDVAIVMYNSFESRPVIWPSAGEFLQRITRLLNLPYAEQTRRMMSHESFVEQRLHKLSTKLLKVKKDNREGEMNALMHKILSGERTIDSLSSIDLNDLGWVLNSNLAKIGNKAEEIMRHSSTLASSTLAPAQTLTAFLPGAHSFTTASPFVVSLGTSNVVAPADVFSRYQGTGMQTGPTYGGPGPRYSQNP